MKRCGMVTGLRPEKVDEYKALHVAAWPAVLKMIRECQIRKCTIFLRRLEDSRHYLFSYFEYHGSDFDADVAKMAAGLTTQRWWALCKPCQEPLADRAPGEWWVNMEEVFHMDWVLPPRLAMRPCRFPDRVKNAGNRGRRVGRRAQLSSEAHGS